MVIAFFERMREPAKQSEPWKARYVTPRLYLMLRPSTIPELC